MTAIRRSILCLLVAGLVLLPLPGGAAQASSAEAEVAFTYGVKAFNHGDVDEAVRLFREAVAADPHDGTARYWLGLALLRQGQHREAAEEIEASLEARRPPRVERSRVEADLRRAQAGEAEGVVAPAYGLELLRVRDRPRFDLRVGGFYGPDSNPALIPAGGIASLPDGTVLFGETEDDAANLDARAALYPFYDRRGLSLGITGEYAAARFADLDFLDQTRWRGAVHLAWGNDPLGYLTGPLGYTRVPFGHGRAALLLQIGTGESRLDGDPMLQEDTAALTFVVRTSRQMAAQIEASMARRDYLDGAVETDAWSVTPSVVLYLGRRERSVRLGISLGEEEEIDKQGLSAELSLPLSEKLVLQLAAAEAKDETSGVSGIDETSREARGALTWAATRSFFVVGRVSQTDRTSNRDVREYDRTAFSLGVLWMR
jgi:hypothetical protein